MFVKIPWKIVYVHALSCLQQQTRIQMYLTHLTPSQFMQVQSELRDTCTLGIPVQSRTAACMYCMYYVQLYAMLQETCLYYVVLGSFQHALCSVGQLQMHINQLFVQYALFLYYFANIFIRIIWYYHIFRPSCLIFLAFCTLKILKYHNFLNIHLIEMK